MAKTFRLGLCENRHEIKDINTYLFKDGDIQFPINPSDIRRKVVDRFNELGITDKDDLIIYVTGLTPALTAVIRIAFKHSMTLTLMHYDKDTKSYIEDVLFSPNDVGYDLEYPTWVACP
jgi:hypothetical protein